jgi:hypothetical protein
MDRYGHWFPAMHDDVATRLEALRQAQNGLTNTATRSVMDP